MSNLNSLSYVLLWDISDRSTTETKVKAFHQAETWPGPPVDPIDPNPIHVNPKNIGFGPKVKPTPSLGGRRTRRGEPPSYVSLSNYNNLP